MKLHHPPGRSGRLWLEHRLAVAIRGDELLRQKRQALALEQRRLRMLQRQTEQDWIAASREAEAWLTRALFLAGDSQLRILSSQLKGRASAELRWRSSMGVVYPAEARALLPPSPPTFPLGGSAAMDVAVPAVRAAVDAAVSYAAARAALARVSEELGATARRVRAIERRWVPTLHAELRDLRLRLDELEREDGVRARWVQRRLRHRTTSA